MPTKPASKDDNERKSVKAIVEAAAALTAEKREIGEQIKDLIQEAKEAHGMHPKVVRQLIKEAGEGPTERAARRLLEEELEQHRHALGFLSDTPLGDASVTSFRQQQEEALFRA